MPFDYNSFMTGVITGLKLGRTKLGRQPPVPSGKYILTESGEKVLMESVTRDDVSIYETGVWYETETYTVRYRFETYYGQNNIDCKFIFGGVAGATPWMFYFSSDPNLDSTDTRRFKDRDGVEYECGLSGQTGSITREGKTLYIQRMTTLPQGYYATPPKDTVFAEGTTAELDELCWDIWFGPTNPMITEGG